MAFLHNNIDPRIAEISIGGQIIKEARQILFTPTHNGMIDREPSEIKADGKVYCYDNHRGELYKILVQLIDDHHLKAESQNGKCSGSESFQKPYNYER